MSDSLEEAPTTADRPSADGGNVSLVGTGGGFATSLEAFEGPLDLLLYLIKENEVEITQIPLALILKQYLSFMDEASQLDLQLAGEFLVMATTLMEIKSRELLPAEEQQEGEELIEDLRSELVRQLLRYRRLKDQARFLEERLASWSRQRPRGLFDEVPEIELPAEAPEGPLVDFDLYALFAAFERISKSVLAQTPRQVHYEGETMEQKLVRIEAVLKERPFSRFAELVHDRSSRADIAMTLVALLELVRRRMIRLLQQGDFGEISVRVQSEAEAADVARQEAAEAEQIVSLAERDLAEREMELRAEAAAQGLAVDQLSWQTRRAILARKRFEGLPDTDETETSDPEEVESSKRIDAILAAADVINQRFEESRQAVGGETPLGAEGLPQPPTPADAAGLPAGGREDDAPIAEEALLPIAETEEDLARAREVLAESRRVREEERQAEEVAAVPPEGPSTASPADRAGEACSGAEDASSDTDAAAEDPAGDTEDGVDVLDGAVEDLAGELEDGADALDSVAEDSAEDPAEDSADAPGDGADAGIEPGGAALDPENDPVDPGAAAGEAPPP